MREAAVQFLATLSAEQRDQVVFPIDSAERQTWAYVPGTRRGLDWKEMTEKQRKAGRILLQASLSEKGFQKVEAIRTLESVLRSIENNPGRDEELYWFVFFGEPSKDAPWVWRYEGHHVSLTFASDRGSVVSSTPQFLGSNPAKVPNGDREGERVLAQEQDLAFELMDSLTAEQRRKAIVSDTAPTDIVTASSRKAVIDHHLGLSYADMDSGQRKLLLKILAVFSEVQDQTEEKRRLAQVKQEGYDHLVFAWLGPVERGGRHYYRIQGEGFVAEYDNTQADGNHIHTVWRDFQNDFGGDALADHYAHGHHAHQ